VVVLRSLILYDPKRLQSGDLRRQLEFHDNFGEFPEEQSILRINVKARCRKFSSSSRNLVSKTRLLK